MLKRVFILSPVNLSGKRAAMLLRAEATFELAVRIREAGAPLGEVFSFISGLYFRGKIAYASAFAPAARPGDSNVFVITASRGLWPADTLIRCADLHSMKDIAIDAQDARYRLPLENDARALVARLGRNCEVVLLGSIATPKYIDPLLSVFDERLLFPREFVGRGDMSRGGLMLRAVQAGVPLTYTPVARATRHGSRPPKLAKWPRAITSPPMRDVSTRKGEAL